MSSCSKLRLIQSVRGRGLGKGKNKLYATIDLERARVGRTQMIQDEPVNPRCFFSTMILPKKRKNNLLLDAPTFAEMTSLTAKRSISGTSSSTMKKENTSAAASASSCSISMHPATASGVPTAPLLGGRRYRERQAPDLHHGLVLLHGDRFFLISSMETRLIHGRLYVTICEADLVEFKKRKTRKVRKLFTSAGGLRNYRLYATIHLERARVGRTQIIEDESVKPCWNKTLHIYCAHQAANVVVRLKDDQPVGALLLGCAYVPVKNLINGEEVDQWHKLVIGKDRKPVGGRIHVKLQYIDVSRDPQLRPSIHSPKIPEESYRFYDEREGCKVTLYQDAHMPDSFKPHIPLARNQAFQQHPCWKNVSNAIEKARKLIYIAGWSVYTEITLIRDCERPKPRDRQTLGELLKKKANEGVRVLMLIWEDRTSKCCKKDGLMATHGQETIEYFKGSKVHCVLCPRQADGGCSFVQRLKICTMFTHHQKTVVTDAPLPGRESSERQLVSFVGGIDLCHGRYDTPSHSLFQTLEFDSAHHTDFYQPSIRGASIKKGGPREPWHDIHSKLEGPIALDVLSNFEQRWRKQGNQGFLFPWEKIMDPVTDDKDHETWNVQLFRSIDGGAAFLSPPTPEEAATWGSVSRKDNIIDRGIQDNIIDHGIQDAYIHAIRRAKGFIYIESQYFLGSSYGWKPHDIYALHLIPKELSLKIVSKIKANKPFRVYVVLPMWPEGPPRSSPVQAILHWQRRTMEMMYKDIAQALEEKGINDGNPRDYLTFFCLGTREVKRGGEYMTKRKLKRNKWIKWMWNKWTWNMRNKHYTRAQKNRRFMIYVHSKMMIVDDEYIFVGSANINQRSMDGARDTEIAMGAYQPYHLAAQEPARGQIHGFRMSLWYEHTGTLDHYLFSQPQSIECIQKMNEIGESYWNLYSSDPLEQDLPGHLLRYPVHVTNDGAVTELPGFKYFPDTKARVLGAQKHCLPPILTV